MHSENDINVLKKTNPSGEVSEVALFNIGNIEAQTVTTKNI